MVYMKVMLVGTGSFHTIHGGGEVYVRNLAAGLLASNHSVSYISIVFKNVLNPNQIRLRNEVVEEWQLQFPRQWLQHDIDINSNSVKKITETIRELAPDMIHAHGWKLHFSLGAMLANKPCVITAHHGGIVCPAGALLKADDTICCVPANDSNCLKCCVKQVPGWRIWYAFLRYTPFFIRLQLSKYIRKCLFIPFLTPVGVSTYAINEKIRAVFNIGKYASKIIAPSPAIAEALIRNGIPNDKISVVPHGIPKLLRLPLSEGLGQRPLRFIFIGRINYVKGLHILLRSCTRLPLSLFELHVVGYPGNKQEQRYYDRLQRKYRLTNLICHGHKARDEALKILSFCDVMIHPAICLEVFGLTISESLSVGRPVIATRCGGPEIQIQDGVNGFLIPPNDVDALVEAMKRFIEKPALVQLMAENIGNVNDMKVHLLDIEKVYQCSYGSA